MRAGGYLIHTEFRPRTGLVLHAKWLLAHLALFQPFPSNPKNPCPAENDAIERRSSIVETETDRWKESAFCNFRILRLLSREKKRESVREISMANGPGNLRNIILSSKKKHSPAVCVGMLTRVQITNHKFVNNDVTRQSVRRHKLYNASLNIHSRESRHSQPSAHNAVSWCYGILRFYGTSWNFKMAVTDTPEMQEQKEFNFADRLLRPRLYEHLYPVRIDSKTRR